MYNLTYPFGLLLEADKLKIEMTQYKLNDRIKECRLHNLSLCVCVAEVTVYSRLRINEENS